MTFQGKELLEVRLAVVNSLQACVVAQREHFVALLAAQAILVKDLLIGHDFLAADFRVSLT